MTTNSGSIKGLVQDDLAIVEFSIKGKMYYMGKKLSKLPTANMLFGEEQMPFFNITNVISVVFPSSESIDFGEGSLDYFWGILYENDFEHLPDFSLDKSKS